jgi:hypothetical protein
MFDVLGISTAFLRSQVNAAKSYANKQQLLQ